MRDETAAASAAMSDSLCVFPVVMWGQPTLALFDIGSDRNIINTSIMTDDRGETRTRVPVNLTTATSGQGGNSMSGFVSQSERVAQGAAAMKLTDLLAVEMPTLPYGVVIGLPAHRSLPIRHDFTVPTEVQFGPTRHPSVWARSGARHPTTTTNEAVTYAMRSAGIDPITERRARRAARRGRGHLFTVTQWAAPTPPPTTPPATHPTAPPTAPATSAPTAATAMTTTTSAGPATSATQVPTAGPGHTDQPPAEPPPPEPPPKPAPAPNPDGHDPARQRLLSEFPTIMTGRDNLPHFDDHKRTTPQWTLADEFEINFYPGTTSESFRPRPPRRLSQEEDRELRKQLFWLLKHGFLEPSQSPYAAPVFFVPKGAARARLRMVTDFRQVNAVTIKDHYPSPNLQEQLDFLAGKRWQTSIDLVGAYHHLPIAKRDRDKAAALTPHGTYRYTVLPFGLTNACATFNRLTQTLLGPLTPHHEYCRAFVDDIGVATDGTFEEHLACVRKVLKVLESAHLYVNRDKAVVAQASVPHLGMVVSRDGLQLAPDRVKSMAEWPTPTSHTDVRTFVGHATYLSRFIPGFSELVRPLNAVRSGNPGKGGKQLPFAERWGPDQQRAFEQLRAAVTAEPILKAPDFTKEFFVQTDASKVAIGTALLQKHLVGGEEMLLPVAYSSRVLTSAEVSWPIYDLEHAAMLHATRAFRPYLLHRKWTVISDHQPLAHLLTQKELNLRQLRHLDHLSQFNFDIVYHPGKSMIFADPLSRPPGLAIPYAAVQPNFSKAPCTICTASACGHSAGGRILDARWGTESATVAVQRTSIEVLGSGELESAAVVTAYRDDPHTRQVVAALEDDRPTHFKQRYRRDEEGLIWLCAQPGVSDIAHDRLLLPATQGLKSSAKLHPILRAVLHMCHDTKTAGHSGFRSTYERTRQRFFARGLYRWTEKYTRDCATCRLNRQPVHDTYGLQSPLQPPRAAPGADLSTDFTFSLPKSRSPTTGKIYDGVQVWVCRLTNRVRLVPCCESITASGAAALYLAEVLPVFGMMKSLVSDRDVRFTASCFQEVMKQLGVQFHMSSPHHAATDGQSEQKFRWLKDTLRMFCQDTQAEWVALLPQLELMMNNTATTSREGLTPMQIWQGFPLLTPPDLMAPALIKKHGAQAAARLAEQRVAVRAAQDALLVAQDIAAHRTNAKRIHLVLKPGDWALVHKAHLTPPSEREADSNNYKLRPRWVGPFKVNRMIGPNAVELDIPRATFPRAHPVFNVAGVEPYSFPEGQTPFDEVVPTTDASGEAAWVVDRVLRHKIQKTPHKWIRKWLVRWVSFNNSQQTWEPIQSFITATTFNSELDRFEVDRVGSNDLARGVAAQPTYDPVPHTHRGGTAFRAPDGWLVAGRRTAATTAQQFADEHGISKKEFELFNFEAFNTPFKMSIRLPGGRAYRISAPE